jgi:hypothetical protein
MNSHRSSTFVILILLLSSLSHAHKPIFTSQEGINADTAIAIEQPNVSQVIYRQLSDNTPQLWLAIDAKKDFGLFVQMGIPVIERLKYFRPAFAIVGPDLPAISLPFSMPKGFGGRAFTTLGNKPRFFHEHFTKTDSWILRSETVNLPSQGRYYVVVYSPCEVEGKFWVSVGKEENFAKADWQKMGEWGQKIRKFHETDQHRSSPVTIDDFSDPNHLSNIGTSWSLVTDRVMGGVSDARCSFGNDKCFNYIQMIGNVSLENNGGFVQVALPLSAESQPFDATAYSGFRFWAKGNGEEYYIHLKNDATRSHRQYYSAKFVAPKNWKQVKLPFEKFKPNALDDKLAVDSLTRMAIVGAKRAYKADIKIGPIEFYTIPDKPARE